MDEELEVMSELSLPVEYSELDRYKDFRLVFLETDEGRRVLKQILTWGRLLRSFPMKSPNDPYLDAKLEGGRNLALRIFNTMLAEPKEQPKSQTRVPRRSGEQ